MKLFLFFLCALGLVSALSPAFDYSYTFALSDFQDFFESADLEGSPPSQNTTTADWPSNTTTYVAGHSFSFLINAMDASGQHVVCQQNFTDRFNFTSGSIHGFVECDTKNDFRANITIISTGRHYFKLLFDHSPIEDGDNVHFVDFVAAAPVPSKVTISPAPTSPVLAGTSITANLAALDQYNNVVPCHLYNTLWTVTFGSNPGGISCSQTDTFEALTMATIEGEYTLAVSYKSVAIASQPKITVNKAEPSGTNSSVTWTVGTFTSPHTVETSSIVIKDFYGNVYTCDPTTVGSLAVTISPGTLIDGFSASVTCDGTNFKGAVISRKAGTYTATLKWISTVIPPVGSAVWDITPGTPTVQTTIVPTPASVYGGQTTTIEFDLADAAGNAVTCSSTHTALLTTTCTGGSPCPSAAFACGTGNKVVITLTAPSASGSYLMKLSYNGAASDNTFTFVVLPPTGCTLDSDCQTYGDTSATCVVVSAEKKNCSCSAGWSGDQCETKTVISMSSCVYDNIAMSFTCTFNYPVKFTGTSTSVTAPSIFAAMISESAADESATLLGSGATCTLPTDTTVKCTLTATSTIALGWLEARQGAILAKNFVNIEANGKKQLTLPSSAPLPRAVISAPSTIGTGVRLSVDGSSSTVIGDRRIFKWTLIASPEPASIATIRGYLPTQGPSAKSFTIPADAFDGITQTTSFVFTLEVTDSVSRTDTLSHTVVREMQVLPVVTIEGPSSLQLYSDDTQILNGLYSIPAGLTGTPSFEWKKGSVVVGNKTSCIIASLSLVPGTTYTFTFKVTVGLVSSSASVTIECIYSSLYALIDEGTEFDRPQNAAFTLHSSSYDPDYVASYSWTYTYSWECRFKLEGETTYSDCGITPTDQSTFTVPSAKTAQLGTFQIRLTYAHAASSRSSISSALVDVIAAGSPSVSIKGPAILNAGTALKLEATIITDATTYTLKWTESTGHFATTASFQAALDTGDDDEILLVKFTGLDYSFDYYTFVCTATYTSGTTTYHGKASFTVILNPPPSKGTIAIASDSDAADPLGLSFIITANDFTDAQLPITYKFGYAVGTTGIVWISDFQLATTFATTLPVGSINLYVSARDALGAAMISDPHAYTVTAIGDEESQLTNSETAATAVLSSFELTQDTTKASQVMLSLSSVLNGASAATTPAQTILRAQLLSNLQSIISTATLSVSQAETMSTLASSLTSKPEQFENNHTVMANAISVVKTISGSFGTSIELGNTRSIEDLVNSLSDILLARKNSTVLTLNEKNAIGLDVAISGDNLANLVARSVVCGQLPVEIGTGGVKLGLRAPMLSKATTGALTYSSGLSITLNSAVIGKFTGNKCLKSKGARFNNPLSTGTSDTDFFSSPYGNTAGYTLYDSTGLPMDINQLTTPVTFEIPITTPASFNVVCKYWDRVLGVYSTTGCTLVSKTDTKATCSCNHLSEFAIFQAPTPTPTPPAGFPIWIIGVIIGGVVVVVGIIIIVACACKKPRGGMAKNEETSGKPLNNSKYPI